MSRARVDALNRGQSLEYCPVLEELVRLRQVTGKTGKEFRDIGALSTINNLHTLRQLMLALKPERTLEVGLSFGGSCLALTATHRDLGHSQGRQHVALDPFQSTVWDDCGIEMVARAGLEGFLDFRPEFSSIELPRLLSTGVRFGLVYVDGSHLFEEVFVDSFFAARLLEEGGVLAFDDSTNLHVRKVLRFVRRNLRENLEELDLSSFRADGGRGLSYRIAKTFGGVQLTAFRRIGIIERKWNAPYRSF